MSDFQMTQARILPGQSFISDDLDWYTDPDLSRRREMMPVLFSRESLPYGPAVSYLFRRFGYPEGGWDPYKELASWTLTTPSPDLLLRIAPHVSDRMALSMRAALSPELNRRLKAWESADRDNWHSRWEAHVHALPHKPWFDQVEALAARWGFQKQKLSRGLLILSDRNGDLPEGIAKARTEARILCADFQDKAPFPGIRLRPARPKDFAADDPLKEIAGVLSVVARDLRRGVRVRDQGINLFGQTEQADLVEHPVAGYPSGAMGNAAPELMADLHGRIVHLGGGDIALGLQRALELLPEPVESPEEQTSPDPEGPNP